MRGYRGLRGLSRSAFSVAAIAIACSFALFAQSPDDEIYRRMASSVAVVLVGDGEGVVTGITPAVAIGSNGVLVVPYHVVKDAKEVQVRLKSGEIFDDVFLLGADERRDIAAIRIQATDLSAAEPVNPADLKTGDGLFILAHLPEKLWSASSARVSGFKLADEVPGAGEGFRIVQFDGVIDPGAEGGIVFDSHGNPTAIVTKEFSADQRSGFAIPISNVKGLGGSERTRSYGSGRNLRVPSAAALRAAKNPSKDPKDLLLTSKTVYITSNTTYFKEQQLINELNKRKEIKDWGWVFTTGSWEARNKADLIIELDHQILSFDFTFAIHHRKSSILISAGKAVISDGASGAPKMADKIVKSISDLLNPPPAKGK